MIQRRPRRRSDAAVNLRGSGMKLDIFNHVFPKKYFECMLKVAPNGRDMHKRVRAIPSIVDMDARFRIMDRFGPDYAQVICLGAPPIEVFGPPPVSTDMAKIANDGMADLVRKHSDRSSAARRAIKDLGAVGVQIFTNVLGKPLTTPETMPLFDLMAKLDLPIWLHPARGAGPAGTSSARALPTWTTPGC